MSSIGEILQQDQLRLAHASGLSALDARFEVQLLMAQALQINRAWLIAHSDEPPPDTAYMQYQGMLERRLHGEPMAYIFGEKEFYGIRLHVTPDVLIPRPETELLVELALEYIPADRACRVLDLGTGSGAIAISLATLRSQAQVAAVDMSLAALQVAEANAQRLGLSNLQFMHSDWWQQIPAMPLFDVIVSNPPYIAVDDAHLRQGDLRFEPISALAASDAGLSDLRCIIGQAPRYLAATGMLLLEHGYDQGVAVRSLLSDAGFDAVVTHRDLAGVERVSLGRQRG
ncbi:protein-(glutamine-N5) methyltransferase, release factor-specific [Sulfuriferula sp. AH1]|uniref:peptide chain release factor N(5)-glutamine methyltransferase n=1 Tax=Sulfuriferula sp. AH1 TaxID=1985873 RepID=UPI000B3B961D|nr:peptide chain release factor N(5)-glutamine methyltransferase [Sulfuriferula sp. AH1]ARU32079.1 protein-(glutamine-N5) methyltransferase, release factor-specific [Sulfuriferula sp. AH1]